MTNLANISYDGYPRTEYDALLQQAWCGDCSNNNNPFSPQLGADCASENMKSCLGGDGVYCVPPSESCGGFVPPSHRMGTDCASKNMKSCLGSEGVYCVPPSESCGGFVPRLGNVDSNFIDLARSR